MRLSAGNTVSRGLGLVATVESSTGVVLSSYRTNGTIVSVSIGLEKSWHRVSTDHDEPTVSRDYL